MYSFHPTSGWARVVAWALAVIITILSVVPPDLRPDSGVPHYFEHFLAYVVVAIAFAVGYDWARTLVVLFLGAFCALIEIIQLFVPGRHARLLDFATDALGACTGVAVASAVKMFCSRHAQHLNRGAASENKFYHPTRRKSGSTS